jgi:hypothetical protein
MSDSSCPARPSGGFACDWSMVIRASQIMAVYPLTEDLVPGDVFLVQTPIEVQAVQLNERGKLLTALQTQLSAFVAEGPREARSRLVRELVNEAYDTYAKGARGARDGR